MIKKSDELCIELQPELKSGNDTTRIINILEPEDFLGIGRLFGINILPPGGSIGQHTHKGDYETYYILKGKARISDNGVLRDLLPGDVSQCMDGDFHSIENIGDVDLEYVAVILNSEKENK